MSKKSVYKKLITESSFAKAPREATTVISINKNEFDFFTSKRVFGEAPLSST